MNEDLRSELLKMRYIDRAAARAAFHASEADPRFRGKFLFQIPVDDWVPEFHRARKVGSQHASRLCQIVRLHGWPVRSLVGHDGADAAFHLLQHSGPAVQRECLGALRDAVDSGEADAEHLAAVSDRIELESGGLQIYGTHLTLNEDGEHVPVVGVDNPQQLDDRRSGLGLTSWSCYVDQFRSSDSSEDKTADGVT